MTTNSLADSLASEPLGRVAAPLREKVTSLLRQAILDFTLQPGQRLVERELIERLGVSRTTIREAIRELSAEGLVTVVPQKGAIVSAPSLEDAIDLYEVRASLESLVVQRFVERATEEQVERLSGTVDHLEAVTKSSSSIAEVLRAKDRFYTVLIEGARSAALQQLLESIQARVQVLRATSMSESGRPLEVVQELRGIVGAISNRESERAAELCAAHIRRASITALSHLRAEQQVS
ncbi:GntR family transcriptional regulator [Agromyces aerolatus]|uniref:GntR family transcriptional regulator n=1 Tax=Agromyces sp. LY-1074 TaxID=3074080 RepID=UPI002864B4B3|nr:MULTISPECIES: GntR family transcriptional regulator [unclassified Agromyces]MDR5700914.1 GntR family transcriptional regulator [Agromyces sp. LY-1074]MDR5707425.1 GntR family transcriptional regulator [Agromyces sp. LY-1358]